MTCVQTWHSAIFRYTVCVCVCVYVYVRERERVCVVYTAHTGDSE